MMRRFILLALLNVTYITNVSGFKPNMFWTRAKTMTKFISGEVYKRGKTILKAPIVAKINIANGGFYDRNKKQMYFPPPDNKFDGNSLYQGHVSSGYIPVPAPVPVTEEYKYNPGGLYEEYRKTMGVAQTLVPVPAPTPISSPYNNLPDTSMYMPPPATVPPPVSPYNNAYNNVPDVSRYVPVPVPAPAPAPVYAPAPVPAPVAVKKEYSTEGLYAEYRKTLQQTNQVSEAVQSSPRNTVTATGFYGGPKKSLEVKDDTILYEPPAVVKSPPHLRGNGFAGSGFYQGR